MKVALMAAGLYAALLGLGRFGYRAVLYPAPSRSLRVPPAGTELRQHRAADGAPVQALHFAARGRRTVVFFHGNGEVIADVVDLGRALVARGLGVVLVEYRGYGGSPARGPSELGLYHDAEAVLGDLHAEGLGADQIVLWGSSLGSGVAVEMALRGHACRLVLSAPYTSIPAVAWRLLPILPMRMVVTDHFDNLAKAPRLRLPTLILHGDRDNVVPYDMGVTLAGVIEGARLITVPGASHNDLFVVAGEPLLDAAVAHALGPSEGSS
jgi:pimeloyl-ACP methyl ester carboxylesterase